MSVAEQPDPSALIAELDLQTPVVGVYDAPDPDLFAPLVAPKAGARRGQCVFHFYRAWVKGQTLHLTADNHGCGGCGRALFGLETREHDEFVDFLWSDEGLRASRDLMEAWVDNAPTHHSEHEHILIGPLKPDLAGYLKTVTFFVNPDQLSVLQHGAYHHHAWGDPDPVTVPFGAGCSELLGPFRDPARPQAVIGGTDIAMRDRLPADTLAFTVTMPMLAQLCRLGSDSFLGKGFLAGLRKARGGTLAHHLSRETAHHGEGVHRETT